jgi:predicted metal-dependent phosphoesterase TrpH
VWYRGDCHLHTRRSRNADLLPEQVAREARDAGLRFMIITEHQVASRPLDWSFPLEGLLVIPGQEVVTPRGHWLALGTDWDREPSPGSAGVDDISLGLAAVRANGGVCVVAHPHAPFPSGTFLQPQDGFDAVEVWNGRWSSSRPWQADNEAALASWAARLARTADASRFHPATGGSDAHLAGQVGSPQTVVLADRPTAPAILAALRAGRSWIAATRDVDVDLTASADGTTVPIGGTLTTANPILVDLSIRGVPNGHARLLGEHGVLHEEDLPAAGAGTVTVPTSSSAARLVRAEVRFGNGAMAALTNPVFLSG